MNDHRLCHREIEKLKAENAELKKKLKMAIESTNFNTVQCNNLFQRWEKLKKRSEKNKDDPLLDITDFICWMQELESEVKG
jgi:hypothetical protein